MSWTRPFISIQGTLIAVLLVGLALAWAEPPSEEVNKKPSTYAPAVDLEYQLTYLMDRIEGDLKDESKFDRRAKRIVRDASTIAALALVLGKHDQANGIRGKASGIIDAAAALASNGKTHASASASYEKLVASFETRSHAPLVQWACVADIEQLMLQVPQLDTSLKSYTKPSRFAKSREKTASLAAALAAIAQVSMFDETYCEDPADHAQWVALCGRMRDAANDVRQAIEQGDPEATEESLRPLSHSCDACHERFRD